MFQTLKLAPLWRVACYQQTTMQSVPISRARISKSTLFISTSVPRTPSMRSRKSRAAYRRNSIVMIPSRWSMRFVRLHWKILAAQLCRKSIALNTERNRDESFQHTCMYFYVCVCVCMCVFICLCIYLFIRSQHRERNRDE